MGLSVGIKEIVGTYEMLGDSVGDLVVGSDVLSLSTPTIGFVGGINDGNKLG